MSFFFSFCAAALRSFRTRSRVALLVRRRAVLPKPCFLAKASERSKDDYGHHSWGNGAYFMEAWGEAALRSGRSETAEEAYLEALAHDPGSVRAPLGLQVLCEQAGRSVGCLNRPMGSRRPCRSRGSRTPLRVFLYHQTRWPWHGIAHQPFDCGGARREVMGAGE